MSGSSRVDVEKEALRSGAGIYMIGCAITVSKEVGDTADGS